MALLSDKKTIEALGSRMNMNVASQPSAFAVNLMKKMGWKEGSGLGKNEDGSAQHIVIHKREDSVGLGNDTNLSATVLQEQWCHKSFSNKLDSFKAKLAAIISSDDEENENKEEKKKKRKEKSHKKKRKEKQALDNGDGVDQHKKKAKLMNDGDGGDLNIDYEALFKATGGARLGMRARMEQKGKIMRTEASESSRKS